MSGTSNLQAFAAILAVHEAEHNRDHRQIKALLAANAALVGALDRIRDVLRGDEYMANADVGIDEIVNRALEVNRKALAESAPAVTSAVVQ